MRLAGIDGCKSGWVAVVGDAGRPASVAIQHVTDLRGFLADIDFALIDMPIGFVSGPAPRDVEPAMRAVLVGKTSSVFPTPCRMALAEGVYHDASFVNEQALGKRLPKQTFMLFPKMREIDDLVRAFGQSRLREGHPEVSFAAMAGAPVLSKKRDQAGQSDRIRLLEAQGLPARTLLDGRLRGKMAADDILDAAALWWSADRFRRAQHRTLPPVPSQDAVGLEMSVIA
jgi:predicted RNase H-like nuclease